MQSNLKAKPEKKPEYRVKNSTKKVLEARAAYQFWPVQTGYGARTLDCLACVPLVITPDMVGKTIGAFVAIETKREGVNTVKPHQGETMKRIRKAGGVSIMVNVADCATVEDKLKWALRTGYVQGLLAQGG